MRSMKLMTVLVFLIIQAAVTGQNPVLFEVEGEPVYLDEFMYIYEKTNRDEADFSRASVEEYLDLYQNFKLKVHKARELHLDTIDALNKELAGYRKQLADAYLSDQDVVESLVAEAHERMQQDVSFSHILIKVSPSATSQEDNQAYEKALSTLDRLRAGEDFEKVALEVSDDQTVEKNQGRIGFVTAMLPDGFYDMETALYTLPLKTYSRPIKTKLGYHIVRVESRRSARGEIEVAHILVRKGPDAKKKIEEIEGLIAGGEEFEDVAQRFSEDKATATKGGYLGFFGINKYESVFESTAFRLMNDGDISDPIQTSIGWHIIKRISVKPVPSYEDIRRTLEARIKRDGRYQIAEEAKMEQIKEENEFEEHDWNRSKFLQDVGRDVMSYQWKAPTEYENQTLFEIGGSQVKVDRFLAYLTKNTATRLRLDKTFPPQQSLESMYDDFVEEEIKAYEEAHLEDKYPEFKALMREYSEGILLFEITKKYVWDKASQDTTGLKNYYREHADRYMWPEKALEETVTVRSEDLGLLEKIEKQLARKPTQKVIKKFNKHDEVVRVQGKLIEREELDPDLEWKKYSISDGTLLEDKAETVYKRIAEIIPRKQKTLEEARGYIIADYQDYLEKQWVEELREEYEIKVNEDVLSSIIKT